MPLDDVDRIVCAKPCALQDITSNPHNTLKKKLRLLKIYFYHFHSAV